MRIIFASGRNYLPDQVDGAILSIHSLLERLRARGHECEIIAGIEPSNPFHFQLYRLRRLLSARRRLAWPDRRSGFPTHRLWEYLIPTFLEERIAAFRPDLVLTQLEASEPISRAAVEAGIPTIVYIMDVEFNWLRKGLVVSPLLLPLSLSKFIGTRVRERLQVEAPTVYPIVEFDRYRSPSRHPRFVTMINPVWEKGAEIAVEVARCLPHREFLLVETWPRPDEMRRLRARIATLPNVRLTGPTLDMREVYRKTAVLLAPSRWEEGFGRVVLEAGVNGIPVVATRIGGLPESLGDGGMLLAASDTPETWAGAVEELLSSASLYAGYSAKAVANTGRDELAADRIVDRFLQLAERHVHQARQSA